jgi:hypothetical protein
VKKETVEILKNFAGINQGILFREGNELRTMSVMKNVFGTATIEGEQFEKEFGIYDLNEFLSTLSLFKDPKFDYGDKSVEISGDKSKATYYFSSPTVIVSPPADKRINVKPGLEFELKSDQLEKLLKAASVMKLKDLEFTTDGIRAYNKQNGGNQYTLDIDKPRGELSSPKRLLVENIKFLPLDYKVTVGNKAVKFITEKEDLEYIVAVEDEE